MAFKINDTVMIFTKPDTFGPVMGMKGFIDEVFDNDYYRFTHVGNTHSPIISNAFSVKGEGGIHGKFLAHDDDPLLIECRDFILGEREKVEQKILAQIALRKLIEGEDE